MGRCSWCGCGGASRTLNPPRRLYRVWCSRAWGVTAAEPGIKQSLLPFCCQPGIRCRQTGVRLLLIPPSLSSTLHVTQHSGQAADFLISAALRGEPTDGWCSAWAGCSPGVKINLVTTINTPAAIRLVVVWLHTLTTTILYPSLVCLAKSSLQAGQGRAGHHHYQHSCCHAVSVDRLCAPHLLTSANAKCCPPLCATLCWLSITLTRPLPSTECLGMLLQDSTFYLVCLVTFCLLTF